MSLNRYKIAKEVFDEFEKDIEEAANTPVSFEYFLDEKIKPVDPRFEKFKKHWPCYVLCNDSSAYKLICEEIFGDDLNGTEALKKLRNRTDFIIKKSYVGGNPPAIVSQLLGLIDSEINEAENGSK